MVAGSNPALERARGARTRAGRVKKVKFVNMAPIFLKVSPKEPLSREEFKKAIKLGSGGMETFFFSFLKDFCFKNFANRFGHPIPLSLREILQKKNKIPRFAREIILYSNNTIL